MSHEFDAGTGLTQRTVDYIADVKKEADWIREFRQKRARRPSSQAAADPLGDEGPGEHQLRQDPLLPLQRPEAQALVGRGARRHQAHLRAARHPGAGAQVPRRRRGAVRLRGRLLQHQGGRRRSRASSSCGSTEGLREHPEIFRKWFGKVIPTGDNKFSALNSAVFSGGSFIYVPPGREGEAPAPGLLPHQRGELRPVRAHAHHRRRGQRGDLHGGLHRAEVLDRDAAQRVVELVALKGAKIQYITVQNWSANVFNLVTKRGLAHEEAEIKWIDCNIGSRLTMKYPGRRPEGPQGPRRGHLDRARQRRPAPGHRRQDDPRRGRDDLEHRLQVDLRRPGPRHLPRRRPHPEAPQGLQEQHGVRRAAHQHQQPHRHLPGHHGPRRPPTPCSTRPASPR
jgi:Fe-S cluster assembly protein SufB